MLMMWKLTLWFHWQPYVKKISKQNLGKKNKTKTLDIIYVFNDIRTIASRGKLPPRLKLGFLSRLGLVLGLGGATKQSPWRNSDPWLGLGLGLRLVLGLGGTKKWRVKNICSCKKICTVHLYSPTNTPRGFHVETTWKRSFPRRYDVESTWCVCREGTPRLFRKAGKLWQMHIQTSSTFCSYIKRCIS